MIWIRWRNSRPVSTESLHACIKKYVNSLSGSDFQWIATKEIVISTNRAWTNRNPTERQESTAVWVSWYPVADRSRVTPLLSPQDGRGFCQLPRQGFRVLPEVPWGVPSPLSAKVRGSSYSPVGIPDVPGHLQCLYNHPCQNWAPKDTSEMLGILIRS